MTHAIAETKEVRWIHIGQTKPEDLEFLQKKFKFHHLDYEDIRSTTVFSKMDVYKQYVFLVLQIPIFDSLTRRVVGQPLFVFVSKNTIVTLTQSSHAVLDALFARVKKYPRVRSSILKKGTMFVLHRLLTEVFNDAAVIINEITQEVLRLEQAIQKRHDKKIAVDLGRVRRNVLFLRHIIDPQRTILTNLLNSKQLFMPKGIADYLDDVKDHLDSIWHTTNNLQMLIDGLFDVNEALLSHRTNEVITFLTITSAGLMVPTLIAGFYGMNVPWLPYVHRPDLVIYIFFAGFVLMTFFVLFILRRPRN